MYADVSTGLTVEECLGERGDGCEGETEGEERGSLGIECEQLSSFGRRKGTHLIRESTGDESRQCVDEEVGVRTDGIHGRVFPRLEPLASRQVVQRLPVIVHCRSPSHQLQSLERAAVDVPSSQSEMVEYMAAKKRMMMIILNATLNEGVHGPRAALKFWSLSMLGTALTTGLGTFACFLNLSC